jgi:hypothetical protein
MNLAGDGPWMRPAPSVDDAQELFRVFPREFLVGERAEESEQVRSQFLVFENVIGDAAGVHGSELKEFEPVVPAGRGPSCCA